MGYATKAQHIASRNASMVAPAAFRQGKFEEADALHQRAMAIEEKVYGPNHPEVATDLNNRADLLCTQVRGERSSLASWL